MEADKHVETLKLIKHLGSGGFAQTWLAEVSDLELINEWGTNRIAIKIPLDRAKAQVLKKELILAGSLNLQLTEMESSNIVRYFGFEIFDGKPVMVMEYISGGSLREKIGKIGRRKKLEINFALKIIGGILNGLEIIHKKKIIHRDIKPENILLDGEIPKIADLGISRMLKAGEMASTAVGTLFYMPPELLRGNSATYNVDLWSLGVTAYEMVYGEYPFGITPGMPPAKIIDLITDLKIMPQFPAEPILPDKLKIIIKRSLEKNPSNRFKTATQIRSELSGLSTEPEGSIENIPKPDIIELKKMINSSPQKVEKRMSDLLKIFPDSLDLLQFSGEFFNRNGKFTEAIEMFKRGIAINPENSILRWNLANSFFQQGEKEESLKALKEAIDLGLNKNHLKYAEILQKKINSDLEENG